MEERRLLLAVALSLLVLAGYQLLFAPPPAPHDPAAATASPGPAPSAASLRPEAAAASPGEATAPAIADAKERRVEVQGKDATLAFTNRGARLVSWRLERFRDSRGRPEEMVQTFPGAPRPLDVETGDAAVDQRLREGLFVPSSETLVLRAGQEAELRLSYAEGDLEAEKVIRVAARGYLVRVGASVRRAGRELPRKITWGPG